jgi:hypothetical protein
MGKACGRGKFIATQEVYSRGLILAPRFYAWLLHTLRKQKRLIYYACEKEKQELFLKDVQNFEKFRHEKLQMHYRAELTVRISTKYKT